VDQYHKVLQQLNNQYGPLVKQQLGSETVVHVFDPDDVKTVYLAEGKWPQVAPLQETVQLYRKKRGLSLGLGNL
jgi:Cytochrome P450